MSEVTQALRAELASAQAKCLELQRLLGKKETEARDLLAVLRSIQMRAVRQQASGGDLHDFQDRLRECADEARAAVAKYGSAA